MHYAKFFSLCVKFVLNSHLQNDFSLKDQLIAISILNWSAENGGAICRQNKWKKFKLFCLGFKKIYNISLCFRLCYEMAYRKVQIGKSFDYFFLLMNFFSFKMFTDNS